MNRDKYLKIKLKIDIEMQLTWFGQEEGANIDSQHNKWIGTSNWNETKTWVWIGGKKLYIVGC